MSVYEDIAAIVGKERITESNLDRICYSHDLAPLSDDLLKGFGATKPDVVVRPGNLSHVADIMKYASQKNISVTPRGGGSWGLGGVLPVGGGIVLDLSGMNRIIEVRDCHKITITFMLHNFQICSMISSWKKIEYQNDLKSLSQYSMNGYAGILRQPKQCQLATVG